MGFWKRWFGLEKKEEIKVESDKQIISTEIPIIPQVEREFLNKKCELCGNIIGIEKRKKAGGKLFHKKCFREQYNQMKDRGRVS
jgi:formylmethanofuran dehydrogenase subunit E